VYFTPKRLKLYLWALLLLELLICLGFRSSIRSGAIDFRGYYTAGSMLRTHNAALLYDYPTQQRLQNTLVAPAQFTLLFFAPPFAALPFALLSFAPYLWALLLFGLVNLALLALAVRVMRPHLRALTDRWRPTPPLLFLSFLPVGLTLVMGQLSIALLLICCLAFALLETNEPLLAGLIFSLALIKLQIALPIALLFLLWRRWRFTLGFLLGAALLTALSAAIIGPHNFPSYLHSLTHTSALAGTTLQSTVGIGPRRMANLYGLFFTLTPTNHLAIALTAIASIALLAWAVTRRPSLPLAMLVAVLVSYHLYPCDLTLLLLPISLLCNRLFADDDTLPQPASPPPHSWLQRNRRTILFCSIGVFLITPALIEIIVNDLIFLLTLPILALAVTPYDWSSLSIPPASRTSQFRNVESAPIPPVAT
jgi:Glycosyltransferase family 87